MHTTISDCSLQNEPTCNKMNEHRNTFRMQKYKTVLWEYNHLYFKLKNNNLNAYIGIKMVKLINHTKTIDTWQSKFQGKYGYICFTKTTKNLCLLHSVVTSRNVICILNINCTYLTKIIKVLTKASLVHIISL